MVGERRYDVSLGCFNEAAGIHRRKPGPKADALSHVELASMRPPEFTGGNEGRARSACAWRACFNEAAGIHRRKHPLTG